MRRALILTVVVWLAACGQPPGENDGGGGGGSGGGDGGFISDGGIATWHRDVAPLVQRHCEGCHVPGGIGPFPLTSYAEASPQATLMGVSVASGSMPPWMPSPSCQSFRDERRLSDAEKDVFARWAAQGAPEGNPADAPAPFDGGTGLATVDATLQPTQPYTPSSARQDDYHCFILDPQLGSAKDSIAYEILPGSRRMVHHVILYSVAKADAQAKDNGEAGPGWTCFGGSGISNAQMLGGWVPGTSTVKYPDTTGVPMAAGKVIAMQVHYNLDNGSPTPDQTVVKLQYAPSPVAKPATLLPLLKDDFNIPSGAVGYSASSSFPVPSALPTRRLWGVLPHMHTLGKQIQVTSDANGCLVDIPKWDFHWQQLYLYAQPIVLTGGSQLTLSCTWNNPGPSPVTWGEGTSDEMCLNYLYLTE